MKARLFFKNAGILLAGSFLLRGLGVGFSVWLSGKIGAEGMGLFQLVETVYALASTLATSGIYLSVTRLVSEELAANHPEAAADAMGKCMLYGIVISALAAFILFFSAKKIAVRLLDEPRTTLSLRILAFALPFMAASSSLRGYFFALRRAGISSSAQIVEQLAHIAAVALFFAAIPPKNLTRACAALSCGCVAGESVSFLYTLTLYLRDRKKRGLRRQSFPGITRRLARITIPVALSSYLKSTLRTVENLLIPRGFKKYGASGAGALAQYGMTEAMVMPVLTFPAAFLTSFSSLLVPEIAEARALHDQSRIDRLAAKVLRYTLLFAAAITGIFLYFPKELGQAIFHREDVGSMLGILAPLVPMFYLDNVADAMLKGLDQQISVLRYSILDSALSIVLLYRLLPVYGVKGYIIVMYASTFLNAALSVARLARVTCISVQPMLWIVKPVCAVLLASIGVSGAGRLLPDRSPAAAVLVQIPATLIIYVLLLFLSGSFTRKDLLWFRRVLRDKPDEDPITPANPARSGSSERGSPRRQPAPAAAPPQKPDASRRWGADTQRPPSESQRERRPHIPVVLPPLSRGDAERPAP